MNHIAGSDGELGCLGAFDFYDLFTGVMTTIGANMMGAVFFAAVSAINQMLGLNGIVRPSTIAPAL
jgi:hypothetical protein